MSDEEKEELAMSGLNILTSWTIGISDMSKMFSMRRWGGGGGGGDGDVDSSVREMYRETITRTQSIDRLINRSQTTTRARLWLYSELRTLCASSVCLSL